MFHKSIMLLSDGADLPPGHSGPAGFLFECAQDSLAYHHYPQAIPLNELIGDFNETKANAFKLARKLLADETECRSVQQLAIFEEIIIRELQRAYHLLHLHDYLIKGGLTECHFTGPSPFASGLIWLINHLKSKLTVTFPNAADRESRWASIKRSWHRLRMAGFSHRVLQREWQQVLNRIDPYHRRGRPWFGKTRWTANATWFYTTAYTFTRIGLSYEPYFPQTFQYLVENPLTGGEPLREAGRPYTSIYAFGTQCMEPSAAELQASREAILSHLESVSLAVSEGTALQLFLNSHFFQSFLTRHLPAGLYAGALFNRWAEITRPAALVVGNPVFEGYALHAARRHGSPTILLQHGILGDFCQFLDPPVDHYVVRGAFWREFLAETPRSRAKVLDPPRGDNGASEVAASREAILFLTAPYELLEFQHKTDLDDIMGVLLSVAAEQERELIVRVHPLENIGYYRDRIYRMMRNDGGSIRLTYSQGPGLGDLLGRSAVAVTYGSTVFLDCLRHRVPIISFAWHDFSYKQQIEEHGVFHFAEDLADFARLLEKSLHGELPAYSQNTKPFLADTPPEVLCEQLASLIRPYAEGLSGVGT